MQKFVYALDVGIGQFNVESAAELERISAIAAELKKTARISLRVNPDVDAKNPPVHCNRPRR